MATISRIAPTREAPETIDVPFVRFVGYFLWLGTAGFGGPIALAGHMQHDLVEDRRWITKQDYVEGLALAQLAPGPLAAQLAIYLGYVHSGILGATAVAIAFVLPSFLMVLALSAAYVRYGGLPWMQAIFYGIGAAVIAIIARSAFKLTKLTLGKDKLLWGIFIVLAASTAWTSKEIVWLFWSPDSLSCSLKQCRQKHGLRKSDCRHSTLLYLHFQRAAIFLRFSYSSRKRECWYSEVDWPLCHFCMAALCKIIAG